MGHPRRGAVKPECTEENSADWASSRACICNGGGYRRLRLQPRTGRFKVTGTLRGFLFSMEPRLRSTGCASALSFVSSLPPAHPASLPHPLVLNCRRLVVHPGSRTNFLASLDCLLQKRLGRMRRPAGCPYVRLSRGLTTGRRQQLSARRPSLFRARTALKVFPMSLGSF